MSSEREAQRFGDIIDNAEAAISYVQGMSYDAFVADRKTVDAVERCLERLIEAAIKIGEHHMREIAPDMEFDAMRGMANLLRHGYDLVNDSVVYNTVAERLPQLVIAVRKSAVDETRKSDLG